MTSHAREALLEDHMRSAYEQSQTSLLEVLLSSDSLDAATSQVGYLLNISEQDQALADEIRCIRAELEVKQDTLRDGRRALRQARVEASTEQRTLEEREAELAELEQQAAELKAAAEQKTRRAGGRAQRRARGAGQRRGPDRPQAAGVRRAATRSSTSWSPSRRRSRRRVAGRPRRRRSAARQVSARGFRWPEAAPRITQEWGPTSFVLEPPYTYRGTYYRHFHGGIDMASGCNTPILAGRHRRGGRLRPATLAVGLRLRGGDRSRWRRPDLVLAPRSRGSYVSPGQPITIGSVIGYEGSTGNSTGCHLHFAVNDHGVWENPRFYLP